MVEFAQKYTINERVDCLDTCNKWCDAKVIQLEGDKVLINFTGFTSKYDEWLT